MLHATDHDPSCPDWPSGPSVPLIVETDEIRNLTARGLAYLDAGFPVHLRGPAGTGKTTLALHMAGLLDRPVAMISGSATFTADSLLGGKAGYKTRRVVDKYVASVVKTETESSAVWTDEILTAACRHGYVLVYDEFTRSPPEANNALLTVLEERLLLIPSTAREENYIRVHPDFRVIFTSNPVDYAGVQDLQDALLDRMITLDLGFFDKSTEERIVMGKTGISPSGARRIVNVVRDFRQSNACAQIPTMRACLMIAQVATDRGWAVCVSDADFVQLCVDVLLAKVMIKADPGPHVERERARCRDMLIRLISHYCPPAEPDLVASNVSAPSLLAVS
ncbi:MAG: gas vesicle protein GvpN [Alphaproteobacteria bacterium]